MIWILIISILMPLLSLKRAGIGKLNFQSINKFYMQTIGYKIYLFFAACLFLTVFGFSEKILVQFFLDAHNFEKMDDANKNLLIILILFLTYCLISSKFLINKKYKKMLLEYAVFGWIPVAACFHRLIDLDKKNIPVDV